MAYLTMRQIRGIALAKEVSIGNMKKADAIRTIQRAEGNFDCFGKVAAGICDQLNCMWRDDCMK
jgi:hypothetical protein